jgi:hypothetical protein
VNLSLRLPSPFRGLTFLAVALTLLVASLAPPPAAAQTQAAPKSRDEVRKETADFLKAHRWDDANGLWLPEDNPPAGTSPTRAQVREELHMFLRSHRWDDRRARWVALTPQRRLSLLSREQVRAETEAFLRTHHWDDMAGGWVDDQAPRKPAKPQAKP